MNIGEEPDRNELARIPSPQDALHVSFDLTMHDFICIANVPKSLLDLAAS